ncbi:MAG TPA: ADOP family duplicated permease [Vicinamibacterales bacterium]|nr:ADOP family duplicated permease [Vicinamibacterales bacterium]
MHRDPDWPSRLYRWALRAYPRHVRHQFEAGMLDAFTQDLAQVRPRGPVSLAGFLVVTCVQAIWFGLVERLPKPRPVLLTLRDAFRSLRSARLVSLVAVGSLALGIGANAALFSILNGLVFKPLPVREPSRLALLEPGAWSNPVWEEIRDHHASQTDRVFAWSVERFDLSAHGEMDVVDGIYASGSLFDVLGVPAALGRTLGPRDDMFGGGVDGPVVVLGHDFWQRRFGGALDIVGRTLTIERRPFTIVGVLPRTFFGPDVGRVADVVLPLGAAAFVEQRRAQFRTASTWLNIIMRLRPGESLDSTAEALRAVQPQIRLTTQPPDRSPARHLADPFVLVSAENGRSTLRNRYEQPLTIILAVAGIVLVIACANLANLLLARAAARRAEFSLRLALGASRARIAGHLLFESLLLATAGALLGMLGAAWGSALLVRQISTPTVPVAIDLAMDVRVVGFAILAGLVTALLFGLGPAIGLSRVPPTDMLKSSGRGVVGHQRGVVRNVFLAAQVSLSLVLVVSAGLFLRTLVSLTSVSLGFDPDRLLVAAMNVQRSDVPPERRAELCDRLRAAVVSVPGVSTAAVSYMTPLTMRGWNGPVEVPGRPRLSDRERLAWVNVLSPGWFSTYGIRVVRGRDIADADRRGGERVALVNEAFANRFFGGEDPVGRQVVGGTASDHSHTVIGVVTDVVYRSQRVGVPPTMYVPWAQLDDVFPTFSITVRTAASPTAQLTRAIGDALLREDGAVAFTIRDLKDQHRATLSQERLIAMLSGFFGVLAMLLAALGLYGVTRYTVSRRRAEIGVRLALGATRRMVTQLVLRRVAVPIVGGIAIGVVLSLWASRFVGTLLFGLEPRDPATLIGASAVLLGLGLLSGWLPARRAARIDPVAVLRE